MRKPLKNTIIGVGITSALVFGGASAAAAAGHSVPASFSDVAEVQGVFPPVPEGAFGGLTQINGFRPYIVRTRVGTTSQGHTEIWIVNTATNEVVAHASDIPANNNTTNNLVRVGYFSVRFSVSSHNINTATAAPQTNSFQLTATIVKGVDDSGKYSVYVLPFGSNANNRQVEAWVIENATGLEVASSGRVALGGWGGRAYLTFGEFTISVDRGGITTGNTAGFPALYDPQFALIRPGDEVFVPPTGTISGLSDNGYYTVYILAAGSNNQNRTVQIWIIDNESGEIVAETDGFVPSPGSNTLAHYVSVGEFTVRFQVMANQGLVRDAGLTQLRERPERPTPPPFVPELPADEDRDNEDDYYGPEHEVEGNQPDRECSGIVPPVHDLGPDFVAPPIDPEIDWSNIVPMPLPTAPVIPTAPVPPVEEEQIEDTPSQPEPEPEPEPEAEPDPIPELGQCELDSIAAYPAWDANSIFNNGNRVIYNGAIFEAQWWTRGDVPGDSPWGSWMEIATAFTADCLLVYRWTADRVFTGGETIYHDGYLWYAQWWTRNQRPGESQWGPWHSLGRA